VSPQSKPTHDTKKKIHLLSSLLCRLGVTVRRLMTHRNAETCLARSNNHMVMAAYEKDVLAINRGNSAVFSGSAN
jgi:hypothetical protein